MADRSTVRMMTRYMAWADDVVLADATALSPEALVETRDTLFGSISGTFDHILLVGEIFRAHLENRDHPHASRHRPVTRPFDLVAGELRAMNRHYVAFADAQSDAQLDQVVNFTYVGGGDGAMTRAEILLHLVNHSTYHRGFISVLLYPHGFDRRANDLTVFLRDAWPAIAPTID
ncbi:MAG: DinB family protein [Pseudomonadota bacterium]